MRPDIFLATIGRGSNGSNALEVTEDRAAVTAESQDNIINRVNNVSQYGPSWHYVPGIGVAGTAYAEVPGTALGDLAFTRASSKTRTNAAGVVETIGNNVPPHDYRNADGTLSSTPRLLLEPQRTNLITFSDQLNNAAWTKDKVTVTANATTAPDGTISADKVLITLQGNTAYRIYNSVTLSAITYSASFYVKAAEYNWIYIRIGNSLRVWFNVSTGVVGNNDSGISGRIESAGNGWFRCTAIIATATAGGGFALLGLASANGAESFTPSTGGQGVFVWGAQLEAGAYPTTYIPTTTAAVTRIADVTTETNIFTNGFFSASGGTWFMNLANTEPQIRALSVGFNLVASNANIEIRLASTSLVRPTINVIQSGVVVGYLLTTNESKIAVRWNGSTTDIWVNGAKVSITAAMTATQFQTLTMQGTANRFSVNETAFFRSPLTDAQLAQLTTL